MIIHLQFGVSSTQNTTSSMADRKSGSYALQKFITYLYIEQFKYATLRRDVYIIFFIIQTFFTK